MQWANSLEGKSMKVKLINQSNREKQQELFKI